jgi:hypothetical protein
MTSGVYPPMHRFATAPKSCWYMNALKKGGIATDGRSTMEAIYEVRLKQFCARLRDGLSKPVNPRGAKTSRWSCHVRRLSCFPNLLRIAQRKKRAPAALGP